MTSIRDWLMTARRGQADALISGHADAMIDRWELAILAMSHHRFKMAVSIIDLRNITSSRNDFISRFSCILKLGECLNLAPSESSASARIDVLCSDERWITMHCEEDKALLVLRLHKIALLKQEWTNLLNSPTYHPDDDRDVFLSSPRMSPSETTPPHP